MFNKNVLIGLIAIIMLVGCSDEPSTTNNDNNSEDEILVYGRGGESATLDPAATTDGEASKISINVMETLIDFKDDTMEIEPGLAKSWEEDEDGLKYTFHLREAKFQDGTDFNAEAVKFNFDRLMDQDHPQHMKEGFQYYTESFGGYKGDEEHIIDEVKVVDEYTVEFHLNTPQAPFLANLGITSYAIGSPTAYEKYEDEFGNNPVGTGPFKFVEWKRDDQVILEKYEEYWDSDLPKVDKLIFKTIPDNSARLTALKTGEIDLLDGLDTTDAESIKSDDNLQLFTRPAMNVGYLGFNVEKEPFDNKKVRQAIGHAINKEELIDAFYGGYAEPAVTTVPPIIDGHDDSIQDRKYDIEKAKELLAEGGYPDGFSTTLWAMPVPRPYMPDGEKIGEALQQELKEIGIDLEIITMEWATYLERIAKGDQDMFLLGWTGDNGHADNNLDILMHESNIGGGNSARYNNDEINEILDDAQVEIDPNKRNDLYKKAQEIVFEDSPVIPLVHASSLLAGNSHLKGYVLSPRGVESLKSISIE